MDGDRVLHLSFPLPPWDFKPVLLYWTPVS